MGHDNFFDHHSEHRRYDEHDANSFYRRDHAYGHYAHGSIFLILNKIWSNKRLRGVFVFVAIALIILLILLIVALIPLLMKLIDYIAQNGLQGLIDSIWKGSK